MFSALDLKGLLASDQTHYFFARSPSMQRGKRQSSITHDSPERPAKSPKTSLVDQTPTRKTKKLSVKPKSSKEIKATEADYKLIDALLQFSVMYNHSLNKLVGVSGFSSEFLPFFAFPVLTRKPVARGTLPVVSEGATDRGYFLGAAHPGHIRLAIIEAFCLRFPKEDPKAAKWELWAPWRLQSMYYPPEIFNRKPGTMADLEEEILTGREYGGLGRTTPKIVSIIDQKLWSYAVSLVDFYGNTFEVDKCLVDTVPEPTFMEMARLLRLHQTFKDALAEKKEQGETIKVSKRTLKKQLEKAVEDDASSIDEMSDSEDGCEA